MSGSQEEAAPPLVEGEGVTAPASETPPVAAAEDPVVVVAPKAPEPDWRDKRIATLTARLRAAEQRPAPPAPPVAENGRSDEEVRQAISEGVRAQREQERFTEQVTSLVHKGKETYKADWDARINHLVQIVDKDNTQSVQAYTNLVATAIKAGDGAEVLYALSHDLEKAQELLDMNPVDQAMAVVRLRSELKNKGPQKESGAPDPIEPVSGRGAPAGDIDPGDKGKADKLSTAEWMRRRNAQLAGKGKGRAA